MEIWHRYYHQNTTHLSPITLFAATASLATTSTSNGNFILEVPMDADDNVGDFCSQHHKCVFQLCWSWACVPYHSQSTTHSLGRNNQSKLCFELFDPAFDGFCSNGFDSQVTNDPSIIIYEYKLHFHWVVQSKQMGMNWQMYLDVAPFTVLIELADNLTPIDASQASPGMPQRWLIVITKGFMTATLVLFCNHKSRRALKQ